MSKHNIQEIKQNIYRRIGTRTALIAIWIAGFAYAMFNENVGLTNSTSFYVIIASVAVWLIYLLRDLRLLKNENALRQQAIERADERTILITYKATRLAATIMLCMFPIAICVLAFYDMQIVIDALAIVVALFGMIYLSAWLYLNKTC